MFYALKHSFQIAVEEIYLQSEAVNFYGVMMELLVSQVNLIWALFLIELQ